MEDFCVELAGISIRIICRFKKNRVFFKDYLTERNPLLIVEPKESDLVRIQKDFDLMDEAEGISKHSRPDEFLENNAIHALLAEKMVYQDVLLMHGSALCMEENGIVFTAKSGTGKSTHTRLWREVFGDRVWMVNDDKPLISLRENSIRIWGSPWNGKHKLSRNACAPLKAIVNLERSEINYIESMDKADAFPRLMEMCFNSQNPSTMIRIINMEKCLLNAVDFYKLGCNMEPEAAEVAWKKLNAQ